MSDLLGAGDGIRTRDPQLGKLMLYQLSYARPAAFRAANGTGGQRARMLSLALTVRK